MDDVGDSYHAHPGSHAHICVSNSQVPLYGWIPSSMTEVGLAAFDMYDCSDLVTYGPTACWNTPEFLKLQ